MLKPADASEADAVTSRTYFPVRGSQLELLRRLQVRLERRTLSRRAQEGTNPDGRWSDNTAVPGVFTACVLN